MVYLTQPIQSEKLLGRTNFSFLVESRWISQCVWSCVMNIDQSTNSIEHRKLHFLVSAHQTNSEFKVCYPCGQGILSLSRLCWNLGSKYSKKLWDALRKTWLEEQLCEKFVEWPLVPGVRHRTSAEQNSAAYSGASVSGEWIMLDCLVKHQGQQPCSIHHGCVHLVLLLNQLFQLVQLWG